MKASRLLAYSALSGMLLWLAWPVSAATIVIFFAFVPLLLVADNTTQPHHFFGYTFVTMLLWNAGTTWWIWNSTDVGSIAAIVANSLLMCLPWWAFFKLKNKCNNETFQYIGLISFWMFFEYVHLNWQLSWPWLTLGNAFATHTNWIQWYEYTGVGGGTLWVLIANIALKKSISHYTFNKSQVRQSILFTASTIFIIGLPILVSNFLLPIQNNSAHSGSNVVVIQPNIDPYQKFESGSLQDQIAHLVNLSEQQVDSNTQLVLWPETALAAYDEQNNTTTNSLYQPVFSFLQKHPNITLVSGIEMYRNYGSYKATATAHQKQDGTYYDALNAAVCLHYNAQPQFYYKSKLVPGVESLPTYFNFLAPIFEQFGGTTGGYGKDTATKVFNVQSNTNQYQTAPIICYESIYGEHVSSYVSKGANLLTILTNDGWWGNTPGHQQHLAYASLRAIETRRWVARSANTGISAVINSSGHVVAAQPWNVSGAIKYAIPAEKQQTFYVKHGDYLYIIFAILATFLILGMIAFKVKSIRLQP